MVHYGSLTMHTHVLVDGFRGQARCNRPLNSEKIWYIFQYIYLFFCQIILIRSYI